METQGLKKKGLRNPLDEAQVRKAVVALQAFLEKQKQERPKQTLVDETEYLSCIITRRLIPGKESLKPIQIDVPHSLYGEENRVEMCLFVKDSDKQRIKEALQADPVPGLSKVMPVKKLVKNFARFEDRRALVGAYDLFLADDRVLPFLKGPLGKNFFARKKQPIPVRVSRKTVAHGIRAVFHRTTMYTSTGACCNVRIGHLGMSVEDLVENIVVGMNNCATHVQKGWNGIQSISIKTSDSVALPIYNALPESNKLPPMNLMKSKVVKRKLDEVVAVVEKEKEQPVAAPAKKKAKKEGGKANAPSAKPKPTQAAQKDQKSTPMKEAAEITSKTTTPKAQKKTTAVKSGSSTPASSQKKKAPAAAAKTPTPGKGTPKTSKASKTPPSSKKKSTPKKVTPKK